MMDAKTLRDLLDYDPETGVFTWRVARRGGASLGDIAGGPNKKGYIKIRLDGKMYYAHRLAWLYMYGVWPTKFVDHINCVESDNRIVNLRIATRAQNMANSRKHAAGLLKGVKRYGDKFQARIRIDKCLMNIGVYDTQEQAHAAYCEAAQKVFGAYHRAG